jgi:hypothetical protein
MSGLATGIAETTPIINCGPSTSFLVENGRLRGRKQIVPPSIAPATIPMHRANCGSLKISPFRALIFEATQTILVRPR